MHTGYEEELSCVEESIALLKSDFDEFLRLKISLLESIDAPQDDIDACQLILKEGINSLAVYEFFSTNHLVDKNYGCWVKAGVEAINLDASYEAIIACFDAEIKINKYNYRCRMLKAICLHCAENDKEALDCITDALNLAKSEYYDWLNTKIITLKIERYEDVVKECSRLVQIYEKNETDSAWFWADDAYYWLMRSCALYKLGRYDESISHYLDKVNECSSCERRKDAVSWYYSMEEEIKYIKKEYKVDVSEQYAVNVEFLEKENDEYLTGVRMLKEEFQG
jgi:tetratricopeptide (TPR) repeat protein